MKNRLVTLFIILAMISLLVSSCGVRVNEVYSDIPGEKNQKLSGENSLNPDSINDSSGVISDTIVDVFKEPDLQSERITQAIFNQPVDILSEQGSWAKVKVVDGYTGWIKSKFIIRDCSSINADEYKYKIVITGKLKNVFSQPKGGITIKEVVMGTEFFSNNATDKACEVVLPGGITGWIKINESGTVRLPVGKKLPGTSAVDFISTAAKFKGTTYLWGGVSNRGIDCSGLTYICSRINGIDLPRDTASQYEMGSEVFRDDVKPGDMLFFSNDENSKDIAYVGIFIGDNQFIHADKSKGYVFSTALVSDYYEKRLVGIRRIFNF